MAVAALPELRPPFRWDGEHIAADLPGARALFTTRLGGVSTGPFASLNLGRLTADDGANVDENRIRVAGMTGMPRERFLYGRQVHGATVRRATEPPGPARPPTEEDGQATALTHHPALVFTADCTPLLLAAEGAVAAIHAGWRGVAAGIIEEGVAALREAGRQRAGHGARRARRARLLLRGRRGGPCSIRGPRRPPGGAQPRPPGGDRREARRRPRRGPLHDVLVRALLLPPPRPRRDRPPGGGRVAGLITGLDAGRISENLARIREEMPPGVELLAAVKYVPLEELETLAAAGVELVGENRAQDLEAKAIAHPGVFRWHFIGQLQSRKVKAILPHAELIHSVASDSALRQLERHGTPETEILVEVNVAGEEGKAGVAPDDLGAFVARSPVRVVGLMTMPPFTEDPEASRPHFAALRELAHEHGLRRLSMGTSQDYRVAAEEGATIVRIGTSLYA